MNVVYWQDLTTREFAALDPERTVALLPLGSIEQHGPHLPVSTDATIAEAMCIRAAARVPAEIPVLVMPTQSVGKSTEHLQYEGTLTHTAETLLQAWLEIGDSVARAGLRKLVFFNGHGGQPQIMEICCRELRIRHDMLCVGSGGGSLDGGRHVDAGSQPMSNLFLSIADRMGVQHIDRFGDSTGRLTNV